MRHLHGPIIASIWLSIGIASAFDWSGKTLLGYRSVHPDQAKSYQDAGDTLTWDEERSSGYWSWYGNGVYLLREFSSRWAPESSDKFCMAYADTDALVQADKVRMPAGKLVPDEDVDSDDSDEECEIHESFKNDQDSINEYLHAMNADTQLAIRIIYDEPAAALQWEILIPPAQLNTNNGQLGIGVVCKDKKEELPTLQRVDVEAHPWDQNFVGQWDSWVPDS